MPAGSTYTPIATYTVSGSSIANYTFTSIPSTYTDLVLVGNYYSTVNDVGVYAQFNSDTGTNYSQTVIAGNGTNAQSDRASNGTKLDLTSYNVGISSTSGYFTPSIFNVMNYANTNTYKTTLVRGNPKNNAGSGETLAWVGLWRSTSAINSIKIYYSGGNLAVGTSMTLYGILSAT